MFCGNCGKQIDDGVKFCPFCGARQDEQETGGEAVSDARPAASNSESSGRSDAQVGTQKKSHLMPVIAMALAAVATVAVVIFGIRFFTGMSKPEDKVFYWEGDELRAIPDITDPDPDDVEIAEAENYTIKISEDKAYLYFYGDISSDGTRGDVCRIPIAKIKNAKTDVEKIVEDVVDDVNTDFGYNLLEDNSIVYVKDENELNWYNGEQSFNLGELGSSYHYYLISEDEKHVIYIDEDGVLLATELSENAETIEIADDVNSYYLTDQDGLCLYYLVAEEKERSLYDYVNDTFADDDAKAVEPAYVDFMEEVKLKDAVSDYDLGRYDNKEDFINDVVANCYWDSDLEAYKYVNTDNYKDYYYNPDRKKWYSEPDYNAYDAAHGEYEAVMERNSLREELKSSSVNDTYYSLYFYKNGSTTEICGSVETMAANDGRAVIYTKEEEDAAILKLNINNIESISDVEQAVEYGEDDDDDGDTFYFVYDGGSEETFSDLKYISSMKMAGDGSGLAVIGKEDPSDDQTKMSYFGLSSGKLGDEVEVSDECSWFNVYRDKFYYFTDMDLERGDLYEFDGKESRLLAKSAVSYSCFIADDGTVAGYSNNDADRLAVFDKDGKDSTIAKNVERFTYIGDGCFLIMKDGDLYYLDEKGDDYMLARDVDFYVCLKPAKGCLI